MNFHGWNLLFYICGVMFVGGLLDSWEAPGIAKFICFVCIYIIFPVVTSKEKKNEQPK